PVDYVGFVFAPSRRRVQPDEAAAMIRACRTAGGKQRFVGVFVNPALEEIEETVAAAALDVLQLHGQETEPFIRTCKDRLPNIRIWKALGVRADAAHTREAVSDKLDGFAGLIDGLLLDAYDP